MSITDDRDDVARRRRGFRKAWRGYDRAHVDSVVAKLREQLRDVTAERDAAAERAGTLQRRLERADEEKDALRARLDRVCAQPIDSDGLAERLLHMIELAHEEADDITERARTTAEITQKAAEDAAKRLRGRYETLLAELDARSEELEAQHRALIRSTEQEANKRAEQAERRRRELDEHATKRRQELEGEFAANLAERRERANRAIAARDAESRQRAERIIERAREQAGQLEAEARERVRALEGVRDRVTDELNAVRDVLARMLELTEPFPDEEAALRAAVPEPRSPEVPVHP